MNFIDRRTLDFLLYDWLHAEKLLELPRYADHSRETFDAVLDLSADMAMQEFAPHYKRSDSSEPSLAESGVKILPEIGPALKSFAEAGLFAASFDSNLGGLQLPHLIQNASMAHFMAANISTAAYPMLTAANARVIAAFGTERQQSIFAKPQIAGRWFGTMCLSEPQAGSSLSDIVTRAVFDGDDPLGPRYRVSGRKMWISGGDQDVSENIVHLVLAKVPGADGRLLPGMGGISLFIVPKWLVDAAGDRTERNDIAVAGLNHKMGYRGTANCLLNFGEEKGAVGYLVGDVGQGLAIMFHMMNEARVAVGLGAAALALRGYRHSLDYARERTQGRHVAASGKAADRPQVPIIEHVDVKRMLLQQKAYGEGALALILYCAKLVDLSVAEGREGSEALELLGLLTPVAKSWPAEFGLVANDLAIQIHGGYGYTRDFDVEQVYRDNRLNPIHEGTHGIQAIDLVGRKIARDKGRVLKQLERKIAATIDAAKARSNLAPVGVQLGDAVASLMATADRLISLNDPDRILDNASAFLSGFGHVVVGWLWLDQCLAAPAFTVDDMFWTGRMMACRFFHEVELPKARQQLDFVNSTNTICRSMPVDAF